jgi:2-dehydropantoate 2-reductase
MQSINHIAIWGVGAMGSLFSGYLSAVAPVTMVGNWQAQIDAVRREGLTIHHGNGSASRFFPAMARHATDLPTIDLAFVLVKSHQTSHIAAHLARVLSPSGVVITLQNGVGNLDALSRAVGAERATQGVTAQGATMLGPGEVRHAGAGPTHIALLPARAALIEDSVALLNQAGIETTTTDSADSLIWGKLAVNAGLNPLTALLEVPNGELLETPQRTRFMIAAAREVEAVAVALGIALPYRDVAAHVMNVARVTGPNISSMLQDVKRHVPTEIDAICGAVVQRGAHLKIPTPVNAALVHLMQAKEQGHPPTPAEVYRVLSQVA